jgi:hypothetical protein
MVGDSSRVGLPDGTLVEGLDYLEAFEVNRHRETPVETVVGLYE